MIESWKSSLDEARDLVHEIAVSVEFIAKHWSTSGTVAKFAALAPLAPAMAASDAGTAVGTWIVKALGFGKKGGEQVGKAMADGIVSGLKGASPAVDQAAAQVVEKGILAARGPDGADAHSPSRKTEKIGEDLDAGIAKGASRGRSRQAMASMADPSSASSGSSSRSSGAPAIQVVVNIRVEGGKDGAGVAQALSQPSMLEGLTKAIREALVTQGVPTQTVLQ